MWIKLMCVMVGLLIVNANKTNKQMRNDTLKAIHFITYFATIQYNDMLSILQNNSKYLQSDFDSFEEIRHKNKFIKKLLRINNDKRDVDVDEKNFDVQYKKIQSRRKFQKEDIVRLFDEFDDLLNFIDYDYVHKRMIMVNSSKENMLSLFDKEIKDKISTKILEWIDKCLNILVKCFAALNIFLLIFGKYLL